ncbi:hypothetical protein WR25_07953 [Diploscapter pachys]|uniref:Guided entry of tail-anchored proteins factor 1 n=1 Tax=Diploscapter pachys TaxID=2018661 RepID=A0A2A2KKQ0_9BILA|nr:hypothetical protein WR25_07953 [Diploscapter pachys]
MFYEDKSGNFDVYSTSFALCVVTATVVFIFFNQTLMFGISALLKRRIKQNRSPRLLALMKEADELKQEQSKFSPSNDFAAYFKIDRKLNPIKEEIEQLKAQESKTGASLKADVIAKVLTQAVGFTLLHFSASYQAFCISSTIFWPVNFMLRFPSYFYESQCRDESLTPVSLFAVIYSFFVVSMRLMPGKKDNSKLKMS